jgi:hypothetical protein
MAISSSSVERSSLDRPFMDQSAGSTIQQNSHNLPDKKQQKKKQLKSNRSSTYGPWRPPPPLTDHSQYNANSGYTFRIFRILRISSILGLVKKFRICKMSGNN